MPPVQKTASRSVWPFVFAVLPIIAVALGGSTARWSEGIIVGVVGLILLVSPPRVSLGWGINAVLGGLLALVATGFLPAGWFRTPEWRAALTGDLGAVLPATLGPQPWLSAESLLLLLGGIGWFCLMTTAAYTGEERQRAGRWFAGGVVALAAAFVASYRLHVTPSFWHSVHGFGPFPNRNQTADFLAVGALPVLASAHLAWRGKRPLAAAGWLAGWGVVVTALFHNFSRAGIGILFAGTAAYLGNEILRSLRRVAAAGTAKKTASALRWGRTPALAASLVLLLGAGFMIFGGDTLERMRPGSQEVALMATTGDFRLLIQRDALDMIGDSPWCGVGLGSFEPVFATYRRLSANELHVIHPESDWLWLTSELGWGAAALVLAGVFLLARRIWPQRSGSDRPLRAAAAFGAAAWALHGFVDVSAHRVGTAWCGLFLLGLALPGAGEERSFRRRASWAPWAGRLLGLLALGTGALWGFNEWGKLQSPGTQEVARLTLRARAEAEGKQWTAAVASASRGLALDPVNWQLYFQRAFARLGAGEDHAAVEADFRRALYLEPFSGRVPEAIAQTWARAGEPDLAVAALLEASRRVPADARGYFQGVCEAGNGDPALLTRLAAATQRDPVLQLLYIEQLPPLLRAKAAGGIAEADPNLRRYDDHLRARLFRLWSDDAPALSAAMDAHPEWQRIGWRWWARAWSDAGDLQQACEVANRLAPKPVVPPLGPDTQRRSLAELQAAVARSPGDLTAALRLYQAQIEAGDRAGALATLHAVTSRAGCPAYFHYLEAVLAYNAGQWNASWEAWSRYFGTIPENS